MRTRVAFVLAVLAIFLTVGSGLALFRERARSTAEVERVMTVLRELSVSLSALQDAETGQRGFLLTREAAYLEPYLAARDALDAQLTRLRAVAGSSSRQLARLAELERAARAKMAELTETVGRVQAGDVEGAMARVRTGEGKAVMDRARQTIALMAEGERQSLAEVRLRQQRLGVLLAGSMASGGAVLLLLTALAALGARRDLLEAQRIADERARTSDYQERAVAILTHDLRSPLMAADYSSARLVRALGQSNDEQALSTALTGQRSVRRAVQIMDSLLDLTHLRLGGGLPLEPTPVDAGEVAHTVLGEVEQSSPDRVALVVDGDTAGIFDRVRLGQLLSNLVTNGLKYGAPERPVTVTLDGKDPDRLRIVVHNDGPPIPAQLLPGLFDPFRRGSAGAPGARESLGLGLYIVREIARAHAGEVTARSREGEGTHFEVLIPRHPPAPHPAAGRAEDARGELESRRGPALRRLSPAPS